MDKARIAEAKLQLDTLIPSRDACDIRIARILCGLKDAFDTTNDWVQWCKENYAIARRDCFRKQRAVLCIDNAVSANIGTLQLLEDLGLSRLDMLADIPTARLGAFLRTHAAQGMTRDELRSAVDEFLCKPKRESSEQLTFLDYTALPKPAHIEWGLDDPAIVRRIDCDHELLYVEAHMKRLAAARNAGRMTDRQLGQLRADLQEDVEAIDMMIMTGTAGANQP